MCKTTVLLREVISQHSAVFNNDIVEDIIESYDPKVFNIERLIEYVMAEVSGHDFVDGHHYDLSDGSEIKTSTVTLNPTKPGAPSHRFEISNVVSSGGQMKTGDIRLVMYNAVNDDVTYYFIPNSQLSSLGINYHPTTKMGRIFGTWNREKNRYNKISQYQVADFETLARL